MITFNSIHLTIIVSTTALVFGLWYASHIYRHPPVEGTTHNAVLKGVAATCTAMTINIIAVLIDYHLIYNLWWLSLLPFGMFILTGGPMWLVQEWRRVEDEHQAKLTVSEIEGLHNKKWANLFKAGPNR